MEETDTSTTTTSALMETKRQMALETIRQMDDDEAYCPTCKKDFESVKRMVYHHNHKHSFKVYSTEICEECGTRFRPNNSKNDNKYCSRKCYGLSQRV